MTRGTSRYTKRHDGGEQLKKLLEFLIRWKILSGSGEPTVVQTHPEMSGIARTRTGRLISACIRHSSTNCHDLDCFFVGVATASQQVHPFNGLYQQALNCRRPAH